MANSKWYNHSFAVISNRYRERKARAEETTSDKEIIDAVNKEDYPYGERRHHPYTQWRKAIKAFERYVEFMNS